MVNYSTALLDSTFSALSDPTRRAILARLSQGASTVKSLAAPFDMSLPAVSKHLRILESAGLLRREIDGRIHRCHLNAEPMKGAAAWIEHYRAFWETQFDALAKFLESPQEKRNTKKEENTKWQSRNKVSRSSPSKSAAPSKPRAKKSSPPGPSANN